jgi:hypothetical protein
MSTLKCLCQPTGSNQGWLFLSGIILNAPEPDCAVEDSCPGLGRNWFRIKTGPGWIVKQRVLIRTEQQSDIHLTLTALELKHLLKVADST